MGKLTFVYEGSTLLMYGGYEEKLVIDDKKVSFSKKWHTSDSIDMIEKKKYDFSYTIKPDKLILENSFIALKAELLKLSISDEKHIVLDGDSMKFIIDDDSKFEFNLPWCAIPDEDKKIIKTFISDLIPKELSLPSFLKF